MPDAHTIITELAEENARLREHLARIAGRWESAQGTALVGEWGLPWAMAADARAALEETLEQPCSACATSRRASPPG